ncbi:hypothetical protein [Alteromonas stellipolaris]|uniref:hypothetical protein n=1 Tax=Alteromonas stellipolaris TaxID=233316 RepID=UPI0026E38AC0|nr:hypothetical protein [Alteromonas stellipolaris]MDO6534079.1 hypothetical protein [Alteromonas stellipolaris]MDO6626027.1 hypothetical protein [Alteromonas stellipolaris]
MKNVKNFGLNKKMGTSVGTQIKIKQNNTVKIHNLIGLVQLTPAHQFAKSPFLGAFCYLAHYVQISLYGVELSFIKPLP